VKSTDVYAQLRAALGPWFKSEGFVRAKGLLSWCRRRGDRYTVVWCQISQDGWEPYAGSKFIVQFQRSLEPIVGFYPSPSRRLASLLTAEEREEVRAIQNSIIAELRQPPPNHPAFQISENVTAWYREQFRLVEKPYSDRHDVWFRYSSNEHVDRWSQFILGKLATCVRTVEAWA